jgi:hypothetical protein
MKIKLKPSKNGKHKAKIKLVKNWVPVIKMKPKFRYMTKYGTSVWFSQKLDDEVEVKWVSQYGSDGLCLVPLDYQVILHDIELQARLVRERQAEAEERAKVVPRENKRIVRIKIVKEKKDGDKNKHQRSKENKVRNANRRGLTIVCKRRGRQVQ